MVNLGQRIGVAPVSNTPVLLDDMLRPMWRLMRYSGFNHGFISPNEENKVFNIIRWVLTALVVFLVLNISVFQLTQLAIEFPKRNHIAEISLNAVMSITCMMAIIFLHQFYTQHNQFVHFFNEWKMVETSFTDCSNRIRTVRIAKSMTALFFLLTISCPFVIFFFNLMYPNSSIYFSYYVIFPDMFSYFPNSIYAVSFYFVLMLLFLSEIVSSFVFYQAGCMIENLKQELQSYLAPHQNDSNVQTENENPYTFIWKKYESIQRWVNRANQLFGCIIIANQFCFISIACLSIYLTITSPKYGLSRYPYIAGVVFAALRTVGLNWLFSHLYLSCGKLKSAVADSLSEKWHLLTKEQRDLLTSFLIRLDAGNLAACPLNLYTIDPTNLLSLLTLHISYVIVLLESP